VNVGNSLDHVSILGKREDRVSSCHRPGSWKVELDRRACDVIMRTNEIAVFRARRNGVVVVLVKMANSATRIIPISSPDPLLLSGWTSDSNEHKGLNPGIVSFSAGLYGEGSTIRRPL
jgi:hypothetical protein